MIRCMPLSEPHSKGPRADLHIVAFIQPLEAQRHRGDHIGKVKRPLGFALFIKFSIHPGAAIKGQGFLGPYGLHIQRQHPGKQPCSAAAPQLGPVCRLQPTRHADMIRVVMGKNNPVDGPAHERPDHQRLPHCPALAGVDAGVNHRPAIPVFQRIDIDMVKRHRQRQPDPVDPLGNLDHFTRYWRGFIGKAELRHHLSIAPTGRHKAAQPLRRPSRKADQPAP